MRKTNSFYRTLSSLLAAALALGSAAPSYDRGGQALAAGNGMASSSHSHALRQETVESHSGVEELKAKLRQVAGTLGFSLPEPASTFARPEPAEGRVLSASGVEEKEAEPRTDLTKMRILIIAEDANDRRVHRDEARHQLWTKAKNWNQTVTAGQINSFQNGTSAGSWVKKERPQLVIIELHPNPAEDIQLLQTVAQAGSAPVHAILIYNKPGQRNYVERHLPNGVSEAFLQNPIQEGAVGQAVLRHIQNLAAAERAERVSKQRGTAAGLEEKIGSLPAQHEILYDFTKQFLSGRVPAGEDAGLLTLEGISHPQAATEWIGVTAIARGLVGKGKGLDLSPRKKVIDEVDLWAQSVQEQVARAWKRYLHHMNFETKGLTPGGLPSGAYSGDPADLDTPTISDVVEDTKKFTQGDPGSSSFQLEGPGAVTLGSFPDEARAMMVVTHINPALETEVLRKHGAASIEELLDPELPIDQIVHRVAELNAVPIHKMDVTVLTGDPSDTDALVELQRTYHEMQFEALSGGTFQPALAASLGVSDGRVRLFARRSGMSEAVFNTIVASLFSADGAIAIFRPVSEGIKGGNDKRYFWTSHVMEKMKALRPQNPQELQQIEDGKIIFSSRQITQPVVGAYTFLTPGRTDHRLPFDVPGVQEIGGDNYEAHTLAFASNPRQSGAGYLWFSRNVYPYANNTATGLEEAPAPVIGFLPSLAGRDMEFSRRLFSGNPAAKGEATKILMGGLKSTSDFNRTFGRLLTLSRGNMEVFAQTFERLVAKQNASVRNALLAQVRRVAQDPGAPNNIPPVSYFNPARYVYAHLQQKALDGFARDVLSEVVETAQEVSDSVDLSDVGQKKDALSQKLNEGRLTKGPYQYEIFWDSLVRKDGETYLTLELLLDGEQGYEKGVVLELQVVIPATGGKPRYRGPYSLQTQPNFSVGLLDPIHFINTRFPEWRPKAQRDIYESRLQALKDSKEKDKRQFIRPSERQGNNPRFFEPFFRAFLDGNVPLAYHIVDALASERDYGNQGGVGSVGNLASAIVRRGGIGATASWLLEEPAAARIVADENRTLVYSYEKDHHRIDAIKDVEGFASELEPFLLAYPENLITGWVSANLEDETKFINPDARKEALKAGETIAQTGVIDETIFDRLQETYNGKPVTEGLPNVFGMHWLRNRWLHDVVDTLAAQGVPITPFNRWYIEPDYALDGKPQTVEELAYLTLMSWVSAQAQGHPLGPVVPSYGNVHGASAGNPSLALAGILQYAAQAAPLYGEPLSADLLAIARKAPRGSIALAEKTAGYFKDLSLREKFLQVVTSADERTEVEEAQLRGFVLAQLQKIPSDVLKTLKAAEQVLLKEVGQAQKEKRQPLPLEEVAPVVAGNLSALTARLDREINTLPLERRAAITTHAASGLSAEQLSKAREYGVWVANKSTEFQNIITKQLEVVYLMAVNPAQAQVELSRMSAAQAAWNAHPLSPEELQRVAALYQAMYDAAAARAIKAAKTDAEKDALRQAASNPLRPFPWFWRDNTGWSMEDPSGKDWSAYDWVPGAHGRYMFSMRDKMTGQGTDNTLLFPNALTWGLPPTVIRMAQAEIERTIHFYHAADVMKASGGAQQYWDYMESKKQTAGLEEIQQAIRKLDSFSLDDRLTAVRTLREMERQGQPTPSVGPILPLHVHVHTDRSYPRVAGVYSPSHMVWAAHQQGAQWLYLVDHETVAHIQEGFAASQVVNEGSQKPLKVLFGVEFKAPVDPSQQRFLEALARGVGGPSGGAWVVGMGVPVTPEGQVPSGLERLVAKFQQAKRERAKEQVQRVNQDWALTLRLEDVLTPEGNFNERTLAYAAAAALDHRASPNEIRNRSIRPVPYDPAYGFPMYGALIKELTALGMVPSFTMQLNVADLEAVLPDLKKLGIQSLDLAGIESNRPGAAADISRVIRLAEREEMPVVGSTDYRGDGAIGWPEAAGWMSNPAIESGLQFVQASVEKLKHDASGLEEGIPLGVADLFMRGDVLLDISTGKRRFVVTADQESTVDSVSIQEMNESGKRVGEPKNIPAQVDFKLRFHALRQFVTTLDRHETHPDVNLRPVTLAPPPGGVLLLQWAPEVPTAENSRFALVRVPEAENRSAGIQVLDQPRKQFQTEQFIPGASQGLAGMQVPHRIRVTAPWETAAKKGKEVAVASPESIALQWNPVNGSLEVQNLPAGYVLLAHRLDISPEAAAAGVEEKMDRLGAAIAAQAASQQAVSSEPAVNSDYFTPDSATSAVLPPVVPVTNPPRIRINSPDGALDYSFRAAGLEEGLKQAQRNFSREPRFFQPLPVDAKPKSAVVVNLVKDERLANLAWALAIMQVKQPGNSPLFRVVVEEKEVNPLLRKWVALDRQALQQLPKLLVVQKSGERNDDAVHRAITELEREGLSGSTQVWVQEINELTLDLAETLRIFFTTGGLNFLTDPDAFAPFKALLEAA